MKKPTCASSRHPLAVRHDQLPPNVVDLLRTQHGVITRPQIFHLGHTDAARRGWLRHRFLISLHPGAYVLPADWATADSKRKLLLLLLATQIGAPDAVAYGTTAAVVLGLPIRSIPTRPEVARAPHAPRLAHCRVRRIDVPIEDTIHRHGLVTTSAYRTVIDVAASEQLPNALITLDAALRQGVDPTVLADHLRLRGDFPGSVQSNATIGMGNRRSESPIESLSRGRMIQRRMPLPLCNVVIRYRGRWVRVDFLWDELGVIGECDGKAKYCELDRAGDALWKEKRRGEWLEDLGFELARWGYPEVADDGDVMEQRFRRAAQRQHQNGWSLPDDVSLEMPMADLCQSERLWRP